MLSQNILSRIPQEVYDHIIDAFGPSYPYIPNEHARSRIRSLLACIRVCRDWRPRARAQLYSTVWVRTAKMTFALAALLRSTPHLTRLINQVVAAPLISQPTDQPLDDHLPLTSLLIANRALPGLVIAHLRLDSPQHPLDRVLYLGTHSLVESLELKAVTFCTPGDLIRLVSSFVHLRRLTLIAIHFTEPLNSQEIHDMGYRQRWGAASLRVLEVGGLAGIPGIHLLGDDIEDFCLSASVGVAIPPALLLYHRHCVSSYKRLRRLRLTIEPWVDESLPNPPGDWGASIWEPIRDYLLTILYAIDSPRLLRQLEIALVPQQQQPSIVDDSESEEEDDEESGDGGQHTKSLKPWTFACRYWITREGMMDVLFAAAVGGVLSDHTFPNLTGLLIVLCENSHPEKAEWWSSRVSTHLPFLPNHLIRTIIREFIIVSPDLLWIPRSAERLLDE